MYLPNFFFWWLRGTRHNKLNRAIWENSALGIAMCNTSRLIWSTVCCQGVGHMERLTNCNCQPLVKLLLLVQKGSCAASESLSHRVQGRKKKKKNTPADSELTLGWFTTLGSQKRRQTTKCNSLLEKWCVLERNRPPCWVFNLQHTPVATAASERGEALRLESQCMCVCVLLHACEVALSPPF